MKLKAPKKALFCCNPVSCLKDTFGLFPLYLPHSQFTEKEASSIMKNIRKCPRWKGMVKDNIEFSKLKQHFEAFNKSENKSDCTVEWYNEALSQFQKWLIEQKKPTKLQAIGEDEVRDFIVFLREQKVHGHSLSVSTISNRVRALRAFFAWLAESGYTKTHLLLGFKPPAIP
jgi:hypothetical protein